VTTRFLGCSPSRHGAIRAGGRSEAAGGLGLDGGRTRARHLLRGDELGASGACFQPLDTPGHQDFSEDTYRTLTAVDSAVMVLDAAKGIEEQTRKLFEVCRRRDVPIITFVNKLDREARDPFDLLDEIEQSLALDVTPASWPIGMGRDFLGTYDLFADALLLFEPGVHDRVTELVRCSGLDDPQLARLLPKEALAKLREVEMAKGLCPPSTPKPIARAIGGMMWGPAVKSRMLDRYFFFSACNDRFRSGRFLGIELPLSERTARADA
jgi:peptide chain release factor 3